MIEKLAELRKTHTQSECARMLGVSRQYINQLENQHGFDGPKYVDYTVVDRLLGKMSDAEISRRTGFSAITVARRRKKLGVPTWSELRSDHCPKCVTEEYARGYCNACWMRARRRERREEKKMPCPKCGSERVVRKWRQHYHTWDCLDCYHRWEEE